MALTDTPPTESPSSSIPPTDDQLTRAKALRRFNWLYIYTPIIVAASLSLIALLLLTWFSLVPDSAEDILFISGLADIILIGWMCPATLIFSLGPIAGIYYFYRRRQHGSYVREPLQRLSWRTDNLLDASQSKIKGVQPHVAKPFIEAHGWVAFFRNILQQIVQSIRNLFERRN